MGRSARSLAALLVGLGIGAVGGAYLGVAAFWPGVVAGVAGLGLALVGSPSATADETAGVRPTSERPALAELGTRVEQILRLAEQQADDHRTKAEREAERILSEARSAARLIVDGARAEAAGSAEVPSTEIDRSPPRSASQ